MTTVRDLRESAVLYRNGRQAAKFAAAYAGFVVLVAVTVVFADALSGDAGAGTFALVVATMPLSLAAVAALALAPGLPETSGAMASGVSLAHAGVFVGVGLLQSWVLWRLGRGPRY